jgi:hypothetical protein
MDSFTINGSEFGVNREKSRLGFNPPMSSTRDISLSVYGDNQTYQALTEAEGSEWSWTLYPPHFYLRGFPVPDELPFSVSLTDKDCEEYDIALYMMEHNFVEAITLSINPGPQVEVRGEVKLSGKIVDFRILWDATEESA